MTGDVVSNTTAWRPRLLAEAVWSEVGDEAVVVRPSDAMADVLNATGARVIALADGTRTVGEIAAALAVEFEVDADTAEADVRSFLDELARLGLLEAPGTAGRAAGPAQTPDPEPGQVPPAMPEPPAGGAPPTGPPKAGT